MWIMLTKKLPTKPSPPKMSIHWSLPWPNNDYAEKQFDQVFEAKRHYLMRGGKVRKRRRAKAPDEDTALKFSKDLYYGPLGKEPHWAGARKILYKNEAIRVFPHEFSILENDKMKMYCEESHELVPGTVAEHSILIEDFDKEKKWAYEMAMVYGCLPHDAKMVALGVDIEPGYEIPPIGWYRIKPEYGLVFCYEEELQED